MQKFINITSLFFFLFAVSSADGKTIPVGKTRQIKTIQKAVDIAQNGDTVLVDPGLYKEGGIVIQKSIVLKGINYPVIDGEHKHEILFIRGKEIIIDGFKLQKTGRSEIKDIGAIMIYDSYHVTAINNIVDDANFGISLQNWHHLQCCYCHQQHCR